MFTVEQRVLFASACYGSLNEMIGSLLEPS
jgi:hypothetical protein